MDDKSSRYEEREILSVSIELYNPGYEKSTDEKKFKPTHGGHSFTAGQRRQARWKSAACWLNCMDNIGSRICVENITVSWKGDVQLYYMHV